MITFLPVDCLGQNSMEFVLAVVFALHPSFLLAFSGLTDYSMAFPCLPSRPTTACRKSPEYLGLDLPGHPSGHSKPSQSARIFGPFARLCQRSPYPNLPLPSPARSAAPSCDHLRPSLRAADITDSLIGTPILEIGLCRGSGEP